jgi:GNAT superfamily N-acetyltransferase
MDEPAEAANIRLRPVGDADLLTLEQMVRAYYAEDGHSFDPVRQATALRAIADGNDWVRGWMVMLQGRAVGYAVVTVSFSVESGGRDGFLDEVYLISEVRNRGLGMRLLDLIDDEARALDLNRLYLEVEHHNPAIRLYRRAGYRDHQRHLMSKDLRPLSS